MPSKWEAVCVFLSYSTRVVLLPLMTPAVSTCTHFCFPNHIHGFTSCNRLSSPRSSPSRAPHPSHVMDDSASPPTAGPSSFPVHLHFTYTSTSHKVKPSSMLDRLAQTCLQSRSIVCCLITHNIITRCLQSSMTVWDTITIWDKSNLQALCKTLLLRHNS